MKNNLLWYTSSPRTYTLSIYSDTNLPPRPIFMVYEKFKYENIKNKINLYYASLSIVMCCDNYLVPKSIDAIYQYFWKFSIHCNIIEKIKYHILIHIFKKKQISYIYTSILFYTHEKLIKIILPQGRPYVFFSTSRVQMNDYKSLLLTPNVDLLTPLYSYQPTWGIFK